VPVNYGGLTSGGFAAFAIGPSGLETAWQSAPGSTWTGWTDLGGDFQGTPAIVPVDDGGLTSGGLEAFAISTSGQLETAAQSSPGSAWGGWTALGGDFAGTPVVVPITASGVTSGFEVFAISTSGQLETAWQTTPGSAWSSWVSLG
jgi:hypothetical protein